MQQPTPSATASVPAPMRAARRFLMGVIDSRRNSGAVTRAFVLIVPMLGFGVLAVLLGQTNSWDLRNYHLYDGWAFWTGRGDSDFAVAQLQSYFNPLLATFTYLLFANLPPWLSTFALGVLQGANFLPIYFIARRLRQPPDETSRGWIPLGVSLVGTMGATQVSELGGSMGDNLVSLPILCAFALVLRNSELKVVEGAFAGLLIGMTTGIKLTAAPFAIGLTTSALLLAWSQRNRWSILVCTGAAVALGFLLTDGFWMLRMYREFGNPLHPMFAHLLGSDYVPPMPVRDDRFMPQTIVEWLFYPLVWLISPHRVSDTWFFDLRLPLAFLAMPFLIRHRDAFDRRSEWSLLLGLALAYVIWLALFGVYRYLAPLEMLAPLIVVLALGRNAPTATVILLALMLACVRPPGWGHIHTYGKRFLDAEIPAMPNLDRATIVFAENEPLSFLALAFPPTAHFVRIGGNLLGPPYAAYGADREAARRIAASRGRPLYAVLADPQSVRTRDVLARQHLTLDTVCAPIHSNLLTGNFSAELCPLQLQPGP